MCGQNISFVSTFGHGGWREHNKDIKIRIKQNQTKPLTVFSLFN